MQPDIEPLIQAIESLQQESNIFKDYIFPIASAFFASLMGAAIAYLVLKHQEGISIEKNKMDATNKWSFLAEEARATLLSIKGNYHGNLTDIPAQRMSAIPSILFHATPILERYEQLSFIVPKAGAGSPKWSQILRIRAMVHNYNYILELWEQRNKIERLLKERVMQKYSTSDNGYINIGYNELIECVGPVDLSVVIDITERVIKLTDDLLIELDDFLLEFPKYAETLINTKKLKKYGSIFKHSNDNNEIIGDLLKKSPDANYDSVQNLFGEPSENIKARYRTGYEE